MVPTIHIKDLSCVLLNIADQRPRVRYLLAVDDANSTLDEVVQVWNHLIVSSSESTIHPEMKQMWVMGGIVFQGLPRASLAAS